MLGAVVCCVCVSAVTLHVHVEFVESGVVTPGGCRGSWLQLSLGCTILLAHFSANNSAATRSRTGDEECVFSTCTCTELLLVGLVGRQPSCRITLPCATAAAGHTHVLCVHVIHIPCLAVVQVCLHSGLVFSFCCHCTQPPPVITSIVVVCVFAKRLQQQQHKPSNAASASMLSRLPLVVLQLVTVSYCSVLWVK